MGNESSTPETDYSLPQEQPTNDYGRARLRSSFESEPRSSFGSIQNRGSMEDIDDMDQEYDETGRPIIPRPEQIGRRTTSSSDRPKRSNSALTGGSLRANLAARENDMDKKFVDPILGAVAAGAAARKEKQQKSIKLRQMQLKQQKIQEQQRRVALDNEWKSSLKRLASVAASTATTVAHVTAPVLSEAQKTVVVSAKEFVKDVKEEWEKEDTQGEAFENDEESVYLFHTQRLWMSPGAPDLSPEASIKRVPSDSTFPYPAMPTLRGASQHSRDLSGSTYSTQKTTPSFDQHDAATATIQEDPTVAESTISPGKPKNEGRAPTQTPRGSEEDMGKPLVVTPYGKGLVVQVRQGNDGADNVNMNEIQLMDWSRPGGSLVSSTMLYSPNTFPSVAPEVGNTVKTIYGRGVVKKIRDDNVIVVQLSSWKLAGDSLVKCYLSPGADVQVLTDPPKQSVGTVGVIPADDSAEETKAHGDSEMPADDSAEEASPVVTPADKEQEETQGETQVEATSLNKLAAEPSAAPEVGNTVKTVYGLGVVTNIRDDNVIVVQLSSWKLARESLVTCYLSPGADVQILTDPSKKSVEIVSADDSAEEAKAHGDVVMPDEDNAEEASPAVVPADREQGETLGDTQAEAISLDKPAVEPNTEDEGIGTMSRAGDETTADAASNQGAETVDAVSADDGTKEAKALGASSAPAGGSAEEKSPFAAPEDKEEGESPEESQAEPASLDKSTTVAEKEDEENGIASEAGDETSADVIGDQGSGKARPVTRSSATRRWSDLLDRASDASKKTKEIAAAAGAADTSSEFAADSVASGDKGEADGSTMEKVMEGPAQDVSDSAGPKEVADNESDEAVESGEVEKRTVSSTTNVESVEAKSTPQDSGATPSRPGLQRTGPQSITSLSQVLEGSVLASNSVPVPPAGRSRPGLDRSEPQSITSLSHVLEDRQLESGGQKDDTRQMTLRSGRVLRGKGSSVSVGDAADREAKQRGDDDQLLSQNVPDTTSESEQSDEGAEGGKITEPVPGGTVKPEAPSGEEVGAVARKERPTAEKTEEAQPDKDEKIIEKPQDPVGAGNLMDVSKTTIGQSSDDASHDTKWRSEFKKAWASVMFDADESPVFEDHNADGNRAAPTPIYEADYQGNPPSLNERNTAGDVSNLMEYPKKIVNYLATQLSGDDDRTKQRKDNSFVSSGFRPSRSIQRSVFAAEEKPIIRRSLSPPGSPPEIPSVVGSDDGTESPTQNPSVEEETFLWDLIPERGIVPTEEDLPDKSDERRKSRSLSYLFEASQKINRGPLASASADSSAVLSDPPRKLQRTRSKRLDTKPSVKPSSDIDQDEGTDKDDRGAAGTSDDPGSLTVRWDSNDDANFPVVPDMEEMTEGFDRDEVLDEALLAFSSLEDVGFLKNIPLPTNESPARDLAPLVWRQLLSRWKHSEIWNAMISRPSSLYFRSLAIEPVLSTDSDTVSSSSTVQIQFQGRRITFSSALSSVDTFSVFRNLSGFKPHADDGEFMVLSGLLCELGPESVSLADGDEDSVLKQKLPPRESSATKEESNDVTELLKHAETHVEGFKNIVTSIVAFSSQNDTNAAESDIPEVNYSIGVKNYSSVRRKAARRYNGDILQVKDILRGQITFPDEGTLVCGLYHLSEMARGLRMTGDHKPSTPSIEIVRFKNLFRTSDFGNTYFPALPSGYRHIIVNIRLEGTVVAELQFQLSQLFAVMGSEGYALHREIVTYGEKHSDERRLSMQDNSAIMSGSIPPMLTTNLVESVIQDMPIGSTVSEGDGQSTVVSVDGGGSEGEKKSSTSTPAAATEGGVAAAAAAAAKNNRPERGPVAGGGGIAAAAAAAAAKKKKLNSPSEAGGSGIAPVGSAKTKTHASSASPVGGGGIAAAAAAAAAAKKVENKGGPASSGGIAAAAAAAAAAKNRSSKARAGSAAAEGSVHTKHASHAAAMGGGGIAAAAAAAAASKRSKQGHSKQTEGDTGKRTPGIGGGGIAAAAAAAAAKKVASVVEGGMAGTAAAASTAKKVSTAVGGGGIAAAAAAAASAAIRNRGASSKEESSTEASPGSTSASLSGGGIAAAAAAAAAAKKDKPSASSPISGGGIAAAAAAAAAAKKAKTTSTMSGGGIAAAAAAAAAAKVSKNSAASPMSGGGIAAAAAAAAAAKKAMDAAPMSDGGIAAAATAAAAKKAKTTEPMGGGIAAAAAAAAVKKAKTTEPMGGGGIAAAAAAAAAAKKSAKSSPISGGGIAAAAAAAAAAKKSKSSAASSMGGAGIAAAAAAAAVANNATDTAPMDGGGIAAAAAAAAAKKAKTTEPVGGGGIAAAAAAAAAAAKKSANPSLMGGGGIAAAAAAAAAAKKAKTTSPMSGGEMAAAAAAAAAAKNPGPISGGGIAAAAAAAAASKRGRISKRGSPGLEASSQAGGGIAAVAAAAAAATRTSGRTSPGLDSSSLVGIAAAAADSKSPPSQVGGSGIAAAAAAAAKKSNAELATGKTVAAGSGSATSEMIDEKSWVKESLAFDKAHGPNFLASVMEAGATEASSNPRDLPAFYCLYLLVKRLEQLVAGNSNESKDSASASKQHDLKLLAQRLLLRSLAISNQATSIGMVGWLEYGSSNPIERTLSLPFEVLQRLACSFASVGDWTKAADVLSTLVMRCEQHLPSYHPTTLSSMLDLSAAVSVAYGESSGRGIIQKASELSAFYLAEYEAIFFDRCRKEVTFGADDGKVFEYDDCVDAIPMVKAYATGLRKELSRELLRLIGPTHEITLLNHTFVGDAIALLANCLNAAEPPSSTRVRGYATAPSYLRFWSMAYMHYQTALKGWLKVHSLLHPNATASAYAVSRCLRGLGRYKEAIGVLSTLASTLQEATYETTSSGNVEASERGVRRFMFLDPNAKLRSIALRSAMREQALVMCVWQLAVLTVEQSPDEGGRVRALSLLHTASQAMRRVLDGAETLDESSREVCLELYNCVEDEARNLFAPFVSIPLPKEPELEERKEEISTLEPFTRMRKKRLHETLRSKTKQTGVPQPLVAHFV